MSGSAENLEGVRTSQCQLLTNTPEVLSEENLATSPQHSSTTLIKTCVRKGERVCFPDVENMTVLKRFPPYEKSVPQSPDIRQEDTIHSGESLIKCFNFDKQQNDFELQKCIEFWKKVMEKNLEPIKCTLLDSDTECNNNKERKQEKKSKKVKKNKKVKKVVKDDKDADMRKDSLAQFTDPAEKEIQSDLFKRAYKEIQKKQLDKIKLVAKNVSNPADILNKHVKYNFEIDNTKEEIHNLDKHVEPVKKTPRRKSTNPSSQKVNFTNPTKELESIQEHTPLPNTSNMKKSDSNLGKINNSLQQILEDKVKEANENSILSSILSNNIEEEPEANETNVETAENIQHQENGQRSKKKSTSRQSVIIEDQKSAGSKSVEIEESVDKPKQKSSITIKLDDVDNQVGVEDDLSHVSEGLEKGSKDQDQPLSDKVRIDLEEQDQPLPDKYKVDREDQEQSLSDKQQNEIIEVNVNDKTALTCPEHNDNVKFKEDDEKCKPTNKPGSASKVKICKCGANDCGCKYDLLNILSQYEEEPCSCGLANCVCIPRHYVNYVPTPKQEKSSSTALVEQGPSNTPTVSLSVSNMNKTSEENIERIFDPVASKSSKQLFRLESALNRSRKSISKSDSCRSHTLNNDEKCKCGLQDCDCKSKYGYPVDCICGCGHSRCKCKANRIIAKRLKEIDSKFRRNFKSTTSDDENIINIEDPSPKMDSKTLNQKVSKTSDICGNEENLLHLLNNKLHDAEQEYLSKTPDAVELVSTGVQCENISVESVHVKKYCFICGHYDCPCQIKKKYFA